MQLDQTTMVPATLVKRYKRFLSDHRLESGEVITASCPNTGTMLGLTTPGCATWLVHAPSPTRKYDYRWELIEDEGTWVGINTGRPNALVEEAIRAGVITELAGYADLRREVKYGTNSRIDLLLEDPVRPQAFVEVKNCHLRREAGLAECTLLTYQFVSSSVGGRISKQKRLFPHDYGVLANSTKPSSCNICQGPISPLAGSFMVDRVSSTLITPDAA